MILNPVPWPDGAKCAVALTFDMDADSILHLEHPADSTSRVSAISMLRYGPEVAVPRIVETYKRFGIKQTFFVPAWCIEQYPRAVEIMLEGGHEVAHHGFIHENPIDGSRDEQAYWLQRSIDVIVSATGQRPRGWRAPLYNFSDHSADLLVEEGFLYDASLMGDDVPYVLRTKGGDLIELPAHWGVDDWPQFVQSMDLDYMMPIKSASAGIDVFKQEFDAMWEHGGLFVGVWHPFCTGRLARWLEVVKLIEYMLKKGKVWFAPMEKIAAYVKACIDNGSYTPRIDHLPYYAERVAVKPVGGAAKGVKAAKKGRARL
jgi:peptidoglycan/xylan/chitin deacetylase (PgdA/CDA1 family)